MDAHRLGISLAPQLPAAVLEVADQFLLLGSTEIAGLPAAIAAFTVVLMCSNWAFRSGWWDPSRVLRLA
jgi:hypothetical protein